MTNTPPPVIDAHFHAWQLSRGDYGWLTPALAPIYRNVAVPDWRAQSQQHGVSAAVLVQAGLVFDALVKPVHLPRLLEMARRHPNLKVVIDHAAKPDIAQGQWQPWAEGMAQLAHETPFACKLSGLLTECGPSPAPHAARRWAQHVIGVFGPERVIWGSDWPVLELAATYASWWQETQALLSPLTPAQRNAILGGNAARVYQLSLQRT